MVRYFKKYDPRIPIHTGQGVLVPFESIFDENGNQFEWGVLATQDGYIIGELENLIRRQIGGVMEISHEEFQNLKKKGTQKLLPSWRESVYPKGLLRHLPSALADVAAAAKNARLPAVVRQSRTESKVLSRPMGVSAWRPTTVSR